MGVMPVHRDREKKESTAEEMEVEEQEHEASSTEEEDSETSSEDCERRRTECLDEMSNLEKQFNDLKDQLYRERLSQVNSKLAEVEAGHAAEYLEPLAVLMRAWRKEGSTRREARRDHHSWRGGPHCRDKRLNAHGSYLNI
uniref:BRMS1 like transcriptional repressor n=1 Tax=Kryptolebias marmoratus TaxID=37003 RepID=A0A3Q3AHG2_KRYMA